MRLLVDILHPAHVHVFRNLANEFAARGHTVYFTLREKECARELLDQYNISYEVLSRQSTNSRLIFEFLQRTSKLWRVVERIRPHFLTGIMGPSISVVGRLRRLAGIDRVRTAIFYDTEMANVTNWFSYPMADYVCTPDCYQGKVHGNHITYAGYHELAYLHPNRFIPDPNIVRLSGVDPATRYFIVRFVSYAASHDLGTSGLTRARKIELVKLLAEHGRVLISSESQLPEELEPYRLMIPASHIHHFLAFASLLVGESATMASECAVLGTPSFYISPIGRGYTDEQEKKYGLVFNFTGERFHSDWLAKVREVLREPGLTLRTREGHARLIADKIDTTTWMSNFFERELYVHFPNDR
jgi:uncharacterized protein